MGAVTGGMVMTAMENDLQQCGFWVTLVQRAIRDLRDGISAGDCRRVRRLAGTGAVAPTKRSGRVASWEVRSGVTFVEV